MCRSLNSIVAALSGAARYVLLFMAAVVLMAPVSRVVAGYVIRDRVDLLPQARFVYTRPGGHVPIRGASPAEAAKIRYALDRLGLEGSNGFGIRVVSDFVDCVNCEGEYRPLSDVIRIKRDVVSTGGEPLRRTLAHEVGHYFDQRFLTTADRRAYMRLRHIPMDLAWASPSETWEQRPVEDFAEVFAVLVEPDVTAPPATEYGPVRDPARFDPLLARMHLRERRVASLPAPAQLLEREIDYLRALLSSSFPSVTLLAMLVAFALYGGARAALETWDGSRFCDYPRRPLPFSV